MRIANWDEYACKFVKVIPREYKRVIERISELVQDGLTREDAAIRVFEEGNA
jgi:glutamate synthase domain-containing protein 3